ncbi:MAG: HAD-IIIC family phosphatase [Bacteroidia bacterium]
MKIYVISDIIFDHIAKGIDSFSNGSVLCRFSYEEDIIGKLLSLNYADIEGFDVLYIHSDQVFHRRPVDWQKAFCNTLFHLSLKMTDIVILVNNSLSAAFKTTPAKLSFGKPFDTAFMFSHEINLLAGRSNIFVFDFQTIITNLGESNFYNYNIGHLYQMPYTNKAVSSIAHTLTEQVKWLIAEEKKVIIVDCDNTLWHGIVGEDGLQGIYCDKNAEGIVHYQLQEFLKLKKEEGFLLCICSKNNEEDVKEAFGAKNFVLEWEDFIIRKINWNDKVTNIQEIAAELNVSTDSFIFIDDNKFELDLVRSSLKNISCFEFTGDYIDFLYLINKFEFRKKQVLKEDIEKTEQYIKQQQRSEEELHFKNIDDFIKSLDIKINCSLNDINDLERLSQMTGKTNQFNFNKQPYTTDQLNQFIAAGGRLYSLKVSDKFGDYGTVGLIMVQHGRDGEVILENFLMSCRALGKKIEDDFFNFVLQDLKNKNLRISAIKFLKTAKNIPAENFYNKINNETNYFRTTATVL